MTTYTKTLYHKAKGGDLRQWRTWAEKGVIYTEYGTVGGKLQVSSKKAEPKNVGRANATTAEEQAVLEAKALWKFKVERKYSTTKEGAKEELLLPMLAHKYEAKKVEFPADVQPKLDGLRCLAYREGKKVVLLSRAGKPYDVPHIQKALEKMPLNTTFDGELYVHGMSCQTITSLVKKNKPESAQLVYYVYDVPEFNGDDTLPWSERREFLDFTDEDGCLRALPFETVASDKDVWQKHGEYVEQGYEGAILRMHDGVYQWGYRSRELLKVKSFQDAEFKVVDAEEGVGKMKGCVVFICETKKHRPFKCTMKVPMEERARMYKERKKYIGEELTVRFFELTDDGIPRFPVGVVFRTEEDK